MSSNRSGKSKVASLLSPCIGLRSTSGRVHSAKENAEREMILKSHRLLKSQHIQRKLSSSRTKHAKKEEQEAKVAEEIKELEDDLMKQLTSVVFEEIAAIESCSHGSLNFLSCHSLEQLKKEFMSEHTLRRFLTARKWDVSHAAAMLLEYYRWREINPVGGIEAKDIETSLKAEKVFMLKEKDWEGRPVLVVIATRHVVENQSLEETIRFVQYCTDKIMHIAMDDEAGVSKMCVFVDLRSVGGHCLDQTALGTMLELMQNYFPERLGTAILWKPPTIFWLAWKLVYNFIPKETRRRMCFAYKQKDVAKFMDPAFVPEIFGGTANDDILTPIEDA